MAYANRRCGGPFLTDRGSSGFRARFAPERDCSGRPDFTSRGSRNRPRQRTFTIIATRANRLIVRVHDRMPMILDEAAAENWMNAGERDLPPLKSLMAPAPDDNLQMSLKNVILFLTVSRNR
jgi:hypothetical protein